ncbi:MAG: DUF559 domain-containing protein [Pseudomonadota bacterium]
MAEKRLTKTARKLRKEMTKPERILWRQLRSRPFEAKFVRQFPIGDFIVDFACRSLRLAIELDGGQHAECSADIVRTKIISAHGYRVIRFWNNEVLENMDGVLQTIAAEVEIARNR